MNDMAKIIAGMLALMVFVGGMMYGIPNYQVWQQGLAGEAMLKRAEQEKLILIETAKAEAEAAEAQAQAIAIVGEAAQKYPEYRQQQFIMAFSEAVQDGQVKMIFVPTEANIPILVNPAIAETKAETKRGAPRPRISLGD